MLFIFPLGAPGGFHPVVFVLLAEDTTPEWVLPQVVPVDGLFVLHAVVVADVVVDHVALLVRRARGTFGPVSRLAFGARRADLSN